MKKSLLLILALTSLSSAPVFSDIDDYGRGYSEPIILPPYAEPIEDPQPSAPPAPSTHSYAEPIAIPSAPPAPLTHNYWEIFLELDPLPPARFLEPWEQPEAVTSQKEPTQTTHTVEHFHTHVIEEPKAKTSKLRTGIKIIGGTVTLPFKITGKMIRGLRYLYHLPKKLKQILIPLAAIYGTDVALKMAGNMGLLNFLPPELKKLPGHMYPLINNGAIYTYKGIKLPFDVLKGARLNATSSEIMSMLKKPLEATKGFWPTIKATLGHSPVTEKLASIKKIANPTKIKTLQAFWNARKNLRTVECVKEAAANSNFNGFIDPEVFAKCFSN